MASKKGKRPTAASGTLREIAAQRDTNDMTPKFCLHYMNNDYDLDQLGTSQQASLAKTLRKLSHSTWKDLTLAGRHGQGTALLPNTVFEGEPKYVVFRYDGKRPMVGVRVGEVFHVLWIEREFGELYDHGG